VQNKVLLKLVYAQQFITSEVLPGVLQDYVCCKLVSTIT